MGKTLKQMILEKIDHSPRGYSEELAKISGSYSSGSNLRKVLKSPDKEFDSLSALLKIVKYIFGAENKRKLMEQYSTEIDPNHKSARHMLEYLSNNRLLDSMKTLMDKMSECKNKESREYAKVYSLQYKWHKDYYSLDADSFIKSVNEVKTSVKELNVYLYLLKFYGAYHKQNYKFACECSRLIANDIDDIKDEYIKSAYKSRYDEALSYIYLRVFNNPEESRKKSNAVLNNYSGLGAVSYAYYTIGCSYMFTSYEESLENLNKSIEFYQSANRESVVKDIQEKVDLLNVIWEKDVDIYTITAKLLQDAKKGYLQVSSLERFKDEIDISFYYLVKGIKENNIDLLLLSLIQFIKTGDTFMGNLPKIELLKRGYNEEILKALIDLNKD